MNTIKRKGSRQIDRGESRCDGCLTVDVASLSIPKNERIFALKVRGDSMIEAHIQEGDVVVMEFKSPGNGDIVAALIDGEAILKRYVVERNGMPYLKAENRRLGNQVPATELVVQGVMVALLRNAKL